MAVDTGAGEERGGQPPQQLGQTQLENHLTFETLMFFFGFKIDF